MADYTITGGRSSSYPTGHCGGHIVGTRATFILREELTNMDTNSLAVPTRAVTPITSSPIQTQASFFCGHINRAANGGIDNVTFHAVRSHDAEFLQWRHIEATAGNYTWTNLDTWVNTHEACRREMVYVLFGTPRFYSNDPDLVGAYGAGHQSAPSDMSKWDAFCTALANRYKGRIKYYEIWNEPNLNSNGTGALGVSNAPYFFFSGTFAQLSEMTRRASQIIKTIDPDAQIISPAITVWNSTSGSADTYFTTMMNTSSGDAGSTPMKDYIDIVGVHLYLPTGNLIQHLPGMIDRVNACKTTVGISGKETWDTESAPILPDTYQLSNEELETFMTRFYLICAGKGVSRSFWYLIDRDDSFGFKDRQGVVAHRERLRKLLMSGEVQGVSQFADGRVIYRTTYETNVI